MTDVKKILSYFASLDEDIKELFRDFLVRENPLLTVTEKHWRPNTDIYETLKGIVIKMELAGVRQDQISIEYKENKLIVIGKRLDYTTEEKITCYQMEINYGEFCRVINLPKDINPDKIKATYQDGFLLIFVPFKAIVKPTVVKIKIE